MNEFVGRYDEYHHLDQLYKKKQSNLVVIYGRRRVGKSTLVEQFLQDKTALHFEGLENIRTKGQLASVASDLAKQIDDPLLPNVQFDTWNEIFDYLSRYFLQSKQKIVLFLDEIGRASCRERV